MQNIYQSSSPIPEANNLFPPLEIKSPSDPNKKLLFTSKVDRDLAALEKWLETDFQTTKNKSKIQAIIAPLIKLQEEDPITQTLSGSNLPERIELYGRDIQTMNQLYPQKQSTALNQPKKQSKYPNEPLALALNEKFFNYIESLNNKTIQEVIPTENQEHRNDRVTIGQLSSPKNYRLKGTALATVIRFLKTNQHDPASTIASLCNSVEQAEERLKQKQLKQ